MKSKLVKWLVVIAVAALVAVAVIVSCCQHVSFDELAEIPVFWLAMIPVYLFFGLVLLVGLGMLGYFWMETIFLS